MFVKNVLMQILCFAAGVALVAVVGLAFYPRLIGNSYMGAPGITAGNRIEKTIDARASDQYKKALKESLRQESHKARDWKWHQANLVRASAVGGPASFYRSFNYFEGNQRRVTYLHTEEGDLCNNIICSFRESILVKGNCLSSVKLVDNGVVHVIGDLWGRIEISGHSEIVIGGTVWHDASIECEGINRIYIGGNFEGNIRCNGSCGIFIEGSASGQIETGIPSTNVRTGGDFIGAIKPSTEAALLYVECGGFFPSQVWEDLKSHKYTEAVIFAEYSDLDPGAYLDSSMSRFKFGVSRRINSLRQK